MSSKLYVQVALSQISTTIVTMESLIFAHQHTWVFIVVTAPRSRIFRNFYLGEVLDFSVSDEFWPLIAMAVIRWGHEDL